MTEQRTYLFDVNVLLALSHAAHVHHDRVHEWWSSQSQESRWATTPVTESGLVRLLSNPAVIGSAVPMLDALAVLDQVRQAPGHTFLVDDTSVTRPHVGVTHLQGHRQVTDLHLLNLARRHGAILGTLDGRLSRTLQPEDARHVEVIGVREG